MDSTDLSKHGYLLSQAQGFLKRSWQRKYCALYKVSKQGIQRLEVFENEENFKKENSPSKIIPLNECIKVTERDQKNLLNLFEIRTKTQCYQFCAECGVDLVEWISAIQSVAFQSYQHEPEKVRDDLFTHPSESLIETMEEVENSIYSGVLAREVYNVTAMETAGSVRCSLEGTYQLILTETSISLAHLPDDRLKVPSWFIYSWPYRYIRRYGRGKESFSFEAGRKCQSGPGLFSFATAEHTHAIFSSVGYYMQTLKRISSESTSAADISGGLSTHESYPESSHFKSGSSSVLIKKEAPIAKPPRKRNQGQQEEPMYENTSSVLKSTSSSSTHESASIEIHDIIQANIANLYPLDDPQPTPQNDDDSIELYDEPFERTDAWKTLGLGDHTPPKDPRLIELESTPSKNDDSDTHLYCKLNSLHLRNTTPVVVDDDSDYSHLQHVMPSSSSLPSLELPPKTETKTNESQCVTRYENVLMPQKAALLDSPFRSSVRAKARLVSPGDPPLHLYPSRPLPISDDDTIGHVTLNDAVYAQVMKKSTKI